MKANLTFAVARVDPNLFSVVCVLIVALTSGALTNSTRAQPCAPSWNYYLDPVGPDRGVGGLTVHNGVLYARGSWSMVAGAPANNVADFDGRSWSGAIAATWPYSGSLAGATGLLSYQGSLYATLGTTEFFPAAYVIGAIWNGTAWAPWPTNGLWHNGTPVNINRGWRAAGHQGRIFAAGNFFHPHPSGTGGISRRFAEFNGTTWSQMSGGYGPDTHRTDIESMVSYQGALYVGGGFSRVRNDDLGGTNTTPAANIARFSGGEWQALPNGGLNGRVYAMAAYSNDLYVGGDFTATADSSISLSRIARLHNGAWLPVGGGLTGARPRSMAVANDGCGRALFIGATSGEANNTAPPADIVPVANVVRWDGVRYSALADGITGGNAVFAMTSYNPGTGEALFVGADSLRDPDDMSFFGRTARWGPAPIVPQVELAALEVIQVVQDWENSVPLIQDKPTLVRAHLQLAGTNTNHVVVSGARLHGRRGGAALPASPLTPMNFAGRVTVKTSYAAGMRTNLNESLNFMLPVAWLSGNVELRLEWTNGVLLCREPAEAGGAVSNCLVQVSFQEMPVPEVKFVNVSWSTNVNSTNRLSADVLPALHTRLRAIYPIAQLKTSSGQLYWTNMAPTNLIGLNAQLAAMRLVDQFLQVFGADSNVARRLYYGAVPPLPRGYANVSSGGRADDIPGHVSSGYVPDNPQAYGRNRHGHEIGHTLARHHAVNEGLFGTTNGGSKLGACSEQADAAAPEFPMYLRFPRLGPLGVSDAQDVYGYDHHQRRLVNPFDTHDLMSYCRGGTGWRWISKYTYTNIQNALINRFGAGGAPPPAAPMMAPQDYLIVRGMIELATIQTDFLPFLTVRLQEPPPPPEPGDFILRLLDAAGGVITDIPFQPEVGEPDAVEEGLAVADATHGSFTITVPDDPRINEAVVLHDAQAIASRIASANPPSVRILFPNGGQSFGAGPITISWTAEDLDNDTLYYLVQYTSDDGRSWTTLAVDWTAASLTVDSETLPAGSEARIRVIATDGFHTSLDLSDGLFSVQNHSPTVAIQMPAADELFISDQQIVFEATAHDLEDGLLNGTNVQWHSSRDGFLGLGAMLLREAGELSEGEHQITVSATDNAGLSANATLSIVVLRELQPALEILFTDNQIILSWPAPSTGYVLEVADSLSASVWTPVTQSPWLEGQRWTLALDVMPQTQFYRLVRRFE